MAALGSKLGKLSLAILENFVEGALGEDFVTQLRAPTDRVLAIASALEQTETIFVATFNDKDLSKALFVDLKQSDYPPLKKAVGEYFDHPTKPGLRQELQKILFSEFEQYFSKALIEKAVDLYLYLLTKELMLADDGFRDNIAALANYEGNLAERRSAEFLEQIATHIVQQQAKFAVGGNIGGSVVIGDGNSINMSAAQQVFRSLHQLPASPADFKGRDELIKQLVADLKHGDGATITGRPIQGLVGMGGIGKTALGVVVAHAVAGEYPDAQIFLDLRGTTEPLSTNDIMRHVVLTFEPKADLSALNETEMLSAYRSVLHGKKAMLFFDNARSAEQVAPLRPPETCAMLVTSRWNFAVPGLQKRQLNVMQPEDAKAFLLELCPHVGEKADELAKACGCLPLALRIAGSFLQVNEGWNVDTYLAQLNDRKSRLTALKQSHADAELKAEPELLASFEQSYHQLSKEDRARWRTLGVFPTTFDADAAQAMWGLADEQTIRLAGLLTRYSLLEHDPTINRYNLHDLLTDYALAQMDEGEEFEARLRHASHYKDVLSAANNLYLEGGKNVLVGLRLFDLEWENIRAGQAWAVGAGNENPDALQLCMKYPFAGAYILVLRLHPRYQIEWLEAALAAARELGEKEYEGVALGNLGNAYADLSETRTAIDFHEQALAIYRETGNRRGEGNTLGNLGLAYADLGETRKAIEFYERALAISRETGDRRVEGNALTNLGNAYADLGEPRRAIEYHEQNLVIARETGDWRSEGIALNNLGLAYYILGETPKAIDFYEGQLVIARETDDQRGEGSALGNLGNAYAFLGETHKAIEFYEQYRVIARESGDRRGERTALNNLGVAYKNLGETRKAIEFHERALVIARETGDRRGEGQVLGNLGNAYADLGETHKAIEFYEQVLVIAREIGDRRGEGNALGNLGLAYANLGETRKAIEFYEGHLDIAREIGDRRGAGIVLGNLGNAYAGLGETRKAIEFYEQSLVITREIGDRRGEGNALFNMGLALYELEEKDRAVAMMKQALEIYEAIEEPNAEKARNALKQWGAIG